MRFDALLHDAVAALQLLIGQKKHGEFSFAVSDGNDGNDGCGGNWENRNTTCFCSSWFEEAEASDGNSARDAQGGELERAKVQRGTFGVLPTVLQRDWKIGGQIVAFQHIGLMHRSACERRADVQHGISLATGRLIGTYDQVAGTIIGQLHPVQHTVPLTDSIEASGVISGTS